MPEKKMGWGLPLAIGAGAVAVVVLAYAVHKSVSTPPPPPPPAVQKALGAGGLSGPLSTLSPPIPALTPSPGQKFNTVYQVLLGPYGTEGVADAARVLFAADIFASFGRFPIVEKGLDAQFYVTDQNVLRTS